MNLAPVVILGCRRPEHLARLFDSLSKNLEAQDTDIRVFIGGPRNAKDWPLVYKSIEIVESQMGFKSIEIENCFELKTGSELIRHGVSQVLTNFENVIVLEDDLVVRSDFLLYMNLSLKEYQYDERVAQVSAWNFGVMHKNASQATYFMGGTTSWGWATWRRAWNPTPDLNENFDWLTSRAKRIHKFNFNEVQDCLGIIEAVIEEDYDAWDVCFYLECFRKGQLVLYPNSSLIINDGFDGSGLNFNYSFKWEEKFRENPQKVFQFPKTVTISNLERAYINSLRSWVKLSIGKKHLFPYAFVRKSRQHLKYYKKGFYQGLIASRNSIW